MINVKKERLAEIKNWNIDSIYVLTDFDRTLTIGCSESSWAILAKDPNVPKEYVAERSNYYAYYRPIEVDENMDFEAKNKLMIEWWTKHINLFIKYKLKESVVNEAVKNSNVMKFRKGGESFLKKLHDNNVPVIIISAGIGNFIKEFLVLNKCNYDNIFIVSNFIKFENGIAVGMCDNIIHSLNKNEVSLPDNIKSLIQNRLNVLLFGDALGDIKMIAESKKDTALKIGFLEENVDNNRPYYEKEFDVVCTDNTSFDELIDTLRLFEDDK